MRLNDPTLVRAEYADETRLAARQAAHRHGEGPDARDVVFAAVAEARPERVLEVGCGQGELAARLSGELEVELTAVDQSERMVELARGRGVKAFVGDVQSLKFPDGSFDCAMAAWMLFHVPDLDRALGELARVLRPDGRLVAATNGIEHLRELYELIGRKPVISSFNAENGAAAIQRHFRHVERREAHGWLVFPDRDAAQSYVDATFALRGAILPPFSGALRVRRTPTVFVAHR